MFVVKVVEKNKRQLLLMVPTSKMLQLTLPIYALFEHFEQSANKLSKKCQSKSYIGPPYQLKRWMASSSIEEITPDLLVR